MAHRIKVIVGSVQYMVWQILHGVETWFSNQK